MRNPLEDKVVTISRATGTLTFAANFGLVAAPPKFGGRSPRLTGDASVLSYPFAPLAQRPEVGQGKRR